VEESIKIKDNIIFKTIRRCRRPHVQTLVHYSDFLKVVYPEAEIVISEVDAVVGVHAGPGLVAIIVSDNPQPISGV